MTWKAKSRVSSALICVACVLSVVTCEPRTTEPGPAEIAYELRMNGKLGEAKQILEDALSQDPDYALGHYEQQRANGDSLPHWVQLQHVHDVANVTVDSD